MPLVRHGGAMSNHADAARSVPTKIGGKIMKYYVEESLSNFQFWSGAKDNAAELTTEQLDQLESVLEDLYPDGDISDTQINDIMWFDFDWVKETLGIEDEEEEEEEEEVED